MDVPGTVRLIALAVSGMPFVQVLQHQVSTPWLSGYTRQSDAFTPSEKCTLSMLPGTHAHCWRWAAGPKMRACALVPCLRSQRFHSSPRDKSAPAQKEQPLFAQAILLTGIALHREEACATPGSEYQCEELLFFQLFYLIWLPFPISCSQENVSCSWYMIIVV